jgi:hypothetical protein
VTIERFPTIWITSKTFFYLLGTKVKKLNFILFLNFLWINYLSRSYTKTKVSSALNCIFLVFFFFFNFCVLFHFLLLLINKLLVLIGIVFLHVVEHFPIAFHLFFKFGVFLNFFHHFHHVLHSKRVEIGWHTFAATFAHLGHHLHHKFGIHF